MVGIIRLENRETHKTQTLEVREIDLLGSIITAECGICGTREKQLVGSTILNRVDSKHFPNNVYDVITQKHQYLGYNSKHFVNRDSLLARDLYLFDEGRDFDVLYFFTKDAYDTTFVRAMEHRILFNKRFHNYAK